MSRSDEPRIGRVGLRKEGGSPSKVEGSGVTLTNEVGEVSSHPTGLRDSRIEQYAAGSASPATSAFDVEIEGEAATIAVSLDSPQADSPATSRYSSMEPAQAEISTGSVAQRIAQFRRLSTLPQGSSTGALIEVSRESRREYGV